ncbi:hypothetical protein RB195_004581 [Necator americanus]|uniref:PAZ domain-containing protein n=2 Tax=Necator americanus TaxID=51031 RepID=A0ABR1BML3_NECAM
MLLLLQSVITLLLASENLVCHPFLSEFSMLRFRTTADLQYIELAVTEEYRSNLRAMKKMKIASYGLLVLNTKSTLILFLWVSTSFADMECGGDLTVDVRKRIIETHNEHRRKAEKGEVEGSKGKLPAAMKLADLEYDCGLEQEARRRCKDFIDVNFLYGLGANDDVVVGKGCNPPPQPVKDFLTSFNRWWEQSKYIEPSENNTVLLKHIYNGQPFAQEKVFMLPASLVPSAGEDATGVRVVVKKVTEGFQVTSNDLAKAVNVRDFEKDKGILEVAVCDLRIWRALFIRPPRSGIQGSSMDEKALMDGKYMGIGLSKSVKVLEGEGQSCSAYVVTDDPRPGQYNLNTQAAMQPINQKNILQLIKRLYVRTTYGKKRTFPIGNIAQAANQLKFQTVEGTQCTVEQYFKKHYNIVLKHPGMFTVSERHSPHTYYPVELLRVAPSQRVTLQQQTPDQVATMIKACATLPQNRLHQTKLLKDALDIKPGNSRLAVAGISVENGFTTVPGRVLPPPSIIYGGNQLVKPIDNCKWNGDRSRFLEPARLYNWAVCATLTPNDSRRLHIKEYIARVEGRCRQRGMDVEPCSEIFNLQRQNFESLKEWYASQKEKDRRYLMFITSDHIKQHDLIKLLEIEYQIVSQEIKGSKVDAVLTRNQNQTLDNVIAKINEKLGGVNYNIMLGSSPSDKANKWLSEKDRMFVGFEISNPPALSKAEIERGAAYKVWKI